MATLPCHRSNMTKTTTTSRDSKQPLPTQIILQSFAYFYCIRNTHSINRTHPSDSCVQLVQRWPIHCHSHADAEHARAHPSRHSQNNTTADSDISPIEKRHGKRPLLGMSFRCMHTTTCTRRGHGPPKHWHRLNGWKRGSSQKCCNTALMCVRWCTKQTNGTVEHVQFSADEKKTTQSHANSESLCKFRQNSIANRARVHLIAGEKCIPSNPVRVGCYGHKRLVFQRQFRSEKEHSTAFNSPLLCSLWPCTTNENVSAARCIRTISIFLSLVHCFNDFSLVLRHSMKIGENFSGFRAFGSSNRSRVCVPVREVVCGWPTFGMLGGQEKNGLRGSCMSNAYDFSFGDMHSMIISWWTNEHNRTITMN